MSNLPGQGPRLIASGRSAIERIAQVMPTANSITVNSSLGQVELRPGTIFSNNKVLVWPMQMTVYYAVDDRLYEYGTAAFLTAEYLNALSAGAARASHMVILAKAEMALLMGIFVPWYGMLGLTAAKVGLLYAGHKTLFKQALDAAPKAIRALQYVRGRYPKLFQALVQTAARDILTNLPSGVSAEDVAFFIGRVIKGIGGLPDVTLLAVAKIAGKTALIVGALHAPSIAGHGMMAAASKQGEGLRKELAAQGIHITAEEANTILREIRSDPGGLHKLKELEDACRELAPMLKTLTAAIHAG